MAEINTIPRNWKLVKVGEYVISVKGKKPKRISSIKTKECSIPYVNIKAFEKNVIDEYTDGVGCVLCEEGAFLMVWDGSRSGYVGKSIKGALGSTLVKLNFPNIDNNYAYYFLQSKYIEINTRAKGVGIPHVDPNILWNYELPIPSLPEQLAIVSKIEELLSDLENGKQQLQTSVQQLKVYRQSLLKWAFEGRLTSTTLSNQTTRPMSAVIEQSRDEAETGELPNGWKIIELIEVVDKISDGPFGSNLKSIDYVSDGVRVIRLENIGEMEFRNEYKSFITLDKYETIKNHTVGKGDIIFSSFISENIRSVILPDYIYKAINKADCFLIRANEKKVLKKYLAYYFSTRSMRNQLVNQIHGATRPRINTKQLKTSYIPVAPLNIQKLIVEELESKLTVCAKIEETINQCLQHTETLRQSILKKAFEGKLD